MKRLLKICLICFVTAGLAGCSLQTSSYRAYRPLEKPGIAPYAMTDSESIVIQALGLSDSSHIVNFRAPADAVSLHAGVYRLRDGIWETTGEGSISLDVDKSGDGTLCGLFAMLLKENYAVNFRICTGESLGSAASYTSDEIELDAEIVGMQGGFLDEQSEIELGKEIPVAMMIYDSGTKQRSYDLSAYFNPSELDRYELVQAVVLKFE